MNVKKKALIIGAGPGGLTVAYELLTRTDIEPIIIEASPEYVGGISRTINYKGNKIDIGGHRFFTKSDRVMKWWLSMLPLQGGYDDGTKAFRQRILAEVGMDIPPVNPSDIDRVMLIRKRVSHILFGRNLFDYPISLTPDTLRKLGLLKSFKILLSYLRVAILPKGNPKNLEEFYISRFGKELYETFFRSYTEKVWGVPCANISAEWGAQRVKGLSLTRAVSHFIRTQLFGKERIKNQETSLIEYFLYPKFGPGHLWEVVAEEVNKLGSSVLYGHEVVQMTSSNNLITEVEIRDIKTGEIKKIQADYVFSTAPVKDVCKMLSAPQDILDISDNLEYRDFVEVGVLLKDLEVSQGGKKLDDNWIYIQEHDLKVGRIQIFNNWSPYLVADPNTTWIGMEYFAFEGDPFWTMTDDEIKEFAKKELIKMNFAKKDSILDATVIRMKKTYPAYFGVYKDFGTVQRYLCSFTNLFPIGRNGMHKYNNQDHSMLTAMVSVDTILSHSGNKNLIWEVNTERTYQEEKNS